jgi:acyl-CoA thioester hydrolase
VTAFQRILDIRWRDVDALGHVNNAVYLTYLEELLTSWLQPAIGDDWVNARIELDWRQELRLADKQVIAKGELARIGNSSLTARISFERPDGVVAAEGVAVVVAWDPETRRSRPLTPDERERLRHR